MSVTALTPSIGYEKAAKIVKKAFQEGISIQEAAIDLQILSKEKCNELLNYRKLANLE